MKADRRIRGKAGIGHGDQDRAGRAAIAANLDRAAAGGQLVAILDHLDDIAAAIIGDDDGPIPAAGLDRRRGAGRHAGGKHQGQADHGRKAEELAYRSHARQIAYPQGWAK